eukprot:gene8112-10012_t
MTHPSRTGGQILVDALKIHGVDTAFGVPGESYLDVLDALHESGIRFIINRQEGGAAFMAEAYGKMTGQPGICFVTRGPGATNASIGVHTAQQDSTPMILFVGQIGGDVAAVVFKQQPVPLAQWVVVEVEARVFLEVGRVQQLAGLAALDTAVGPAVQGADDVAARAALLLGVQRPFALEHDGLAVAADVGDQLDATLGVAHQGAALALLGQ